MRAGNPLESLHAALAHAEYKGLSPFEYEDRDWEHYRKTKEDKRIKKMRKPSAYDIAVVAMFPQQWGSTALGFGGIGGQAITEAYVVIVECRQNGQHAVYFGGRHAYTIDCPNGFFTEDMTAKRMADVSGAKVRYEAKHPPQT
jgi:hypothetical protein